MQNWQIGLVVLLLIIFLYYAFLCRPITVIEEGDYWYDPAIAAGIDLNKYKLSHCRDQWYVNGKATKIGSGGWDQPCPTNLICSGINGNVGNYGYASDQMDLVKKFIDGAPLIV